MNVHGHGVIHAFYETPKGKNFSTRKEFPITTATRATYESTILNAVEALL